jgi:hypothetical protein
MKTAMSCWPDGIDLCFPKLTCERLGNSDHEPFLVFLCAILGQTSHVDIEVDFHSVADSR